MVAVIGGIRHFLHGPGPGKLAFLNALGQEPPVFLDPGLRRRVGTAAEMEATQL